MLAIASSTPAPAGFSADAGERGQVVDASGAADAGADSQGRVAPRVNVRIVGAEVLPPEVYLEMLRLPALALPNAATAAQVQIQMLDYLGRTGFQLASVGATVENGDIVVYLNEGQLERVIFPGQLSFQQVRFKLALSLPANVFNRPLLDRQTRELAEAMGLVGVRWELVRTGEVDHSGPQIEELPKAFDMAMQGTQLIHARRPYEVRIHFPSTAGGTGLGLSLRTSNTDGLETGLNNRWGSLFGEGDRLYLGGSGGIGLRPRLDTEKLYFHFSRGSAEARYDTVPLLKRLRPNLWVQNDWLARQRGDLNLENYWAVTVVGAAQLELEISAGLHLLFGAGFEWRRLFGFTPQTGFELPLSVLRYEAVDRKRPLLRLTGEWV
ncbi:MAG: uncharacterized protein H6Q89_4441, partial [Myxococcaceae bacterium]|nr:uncharacterized protein [Myxococcaceae bacterium]